MFNVHIELCCYIYVTLTEATDFQEKQEKSLYFMALFVLDIFVCCMAVDKLEL